MDAKLPSKAEVKLHKKLSAQIQHWYPDCPDYGRLLPHVNSLNQVMTSSAEDGGGLFLCGSVVDGTIVCNMRRELLCCDVIHECLFTLPEVVEIVESIVWHFQDRPADVAIDITDTKLHQASPLNLSTAETAHQGRSLLSGDALMRIYKVTTWETPGKIQSKSWSKRKPSHRKNILLTEMKSVFKVHCYPAIKCKWWPTVAEEYISRKRPWPDYSTVESIVKSGYYIIPKSYFLHNFTTEWRISFAAAENILLSAMTPHHRRCFGLFKVMFMDIVGAYENSGITTNELKNVFMWSCEKRHDMWKRNSLGECLLSLFQDLHQSLAHKRLPMYFLASHDLLASQPEEAVIDVAVMLDQFIAKTQLRPSGNFPRLCDLYPSFVKQRINQYGADAAYHTLSQVLIGFSKYVLVGEEPREEPAQIAKNIIEHEVQLLNKSLAGIRRIFIGSLVSSDVKEKLVKSLAAFFTKARSAYGKRTNIKS